MGQANGPMGSPVSRGADARCAIGDRSSTPAWRGGQWDQQPPTTGDTTWADSSHVGIKVKMTNKNGSRGVGTRED